MSVRKNAIFRNVPGNRIIFRNFKGAASQFNSLGKRKFTLVLDESDIDFINQMIEDGWNIKTRESNNGDISHTIEIEARFDSFPPKVILVSDTKTRLDEDSVGILDDSDIANVDLEVTPYNWTVNGKSGVKAYVKTMYVTLNKDAFEDAYADIPYSNEPIMDDPMDDVPF